MDKKIKYNRLEILMGVFRTDGVKISHNTCPLKKLYYVNYFPHISKILPLDAREYLVE